ncbi:MAG: hypothetical protein QXR35_05715 [Candidatus Korarchaeum sp.]
MSRGTLISLYAVISGWALILLSLLLVKPVISPGSSGLAEAVMYVLLGALSIAAALFLWYESIKVAFLKVKASGPGGT